MTPTTKPQPQSLGYNPLSPYTDNDTTFTNNLLCPRYAENDPTSAPPSPASLESFDILDSIPWRRSYVSLDNGMVEGGKIHTFWKHLQKHRARVVAISIMLALLVTGCALGGYLAVTRTRDELREQCIVRSGGEKCEQIKWAKCIAKNGLGYCEGYM